MIFLNPKDVNFFLLRFVEPINIKINIFTFDNGSIIIIECLARRKLKKILQKSFNYQHQHFAEKTKEQSAHGQLPGEEDFKQKEECWRTCCPSDL